METEKETPSTSSRGVGPVTLSTTVAAGVTTIAVWIISLYGVDVPPEVQGGFTMLIVFCAGLIIPSKRGKRSL